MSGCGVTGHYDHLLGILGSYNAFAWVLSAGSSPGATVGPGVRAEQTVGVKGAL